MTRSYSTLLFWFAATLVASLLLYHTSDRVTALGQQLNSLNAQIESEQQSLHVLKAEWVYLANPARVDAATRRHLDLQPTAPRRVVSMKDLNSLLPMRDGAAPAPRHDVAEAAPTPAAAIVAAAAPTPVPTAHGKSGHVITALNAGGHINESMAMPHGAAVAASTDSIGALIGSLSLHP